MKLPRINAAALALLLCPLASGQEIKLLPSNPQPEFYFGQSCGLHGNISIIGAPGTQGVSVNSAYLFNVTNGAQLLPILLPADGADIDTWRGFGGSVAISDSTAIVGASADEDNGSDSGSAYLFDTITGTQIAKLLPSDGSPGDQFGHSVAISSTTAIAIVGAPDDDDNGYQSGSAYLFDTITGALIAKLLPDDGASYDNFGRSVGISGTIAIVGAEGDDENGSGSGSAYLFDVITGTQIAKLLPNDGSSNDYFGCSVAISDRTVIVGAKGGDDNNGYNSGSAYLFDITTNTQIAKLLANDSYYGDRFGYSVAINNFTAIVGAPYDDDNGYYSSGSAYVFSTTTGLQIAKVLPSDGDYYHEYGTSVAINGSTTLAGAIGVPHYGHTIYDMETAAGWTGGVSGDTATAGQWVRGDPRGTAAQPEDDHSQDGTRCWFTGQGSAGGAVGEEDIDGGYTTLLSPAMDLSAMFDPVISYWRWYSNHAGSNPYSDTFEIYIHDDIGTAWTNVEVVGPTSEATGYWRKHSFDVSDYVDLTDSVSMRFRASDLEEGSCVEAAIDDLEIIDEFSDRGAAYTFNYDCDANGLVDSDEIFFSPGLDCDLDGYLDSCALADGTVTDCNSNGVPDNCDILSGDEEDSNGDGVPDSCQTSSDDDDGDDGDDGGDGGDGDDGGGCGIIPVSGSPTGKELLEHYAALLLLVLFVAGRSLSTKRAAPTTA